MKKILAAIAFIAMTTPAYAGVTTYTETLDIYQLRSNFDNYNPGDPDWVHANPSEAPGLLTPEEYEAAAVAGDVEATLTIQVEGLDLGDYVSVMIQDRYDNWHGLGLLNTMDFYGGSSPLSGELAHDDYRTTTTFDLDPLWLDGLPVQIVLYGWFGSPANEIEIETSTLSVAIHTPAPGALLLGSMGITLVGWLRRRRIV